MIEQNTRAPRHERPIVKAARLIADRRVTARPEAMVYDVRGDHHTYRVIVDSSGIHCPCAARITLCSHALAAMALRARDDLVDEEATA